MELVDEGCKYYSNGSWELYAQVPGQFSSTHGMTADCFDPIPVLKACRPQGSYRLPAECLVGVCWKNMMKASYIQNMITMQEF